jgi:hypothetical protein
VIDRWLVFAAVEPESFGVQRRHGGSTGVFEKTSGPTITAAQAAKQMAKRFG